MKNIDSMLKEYVRRLNDDELRFLFSRYSQLLCGDRAEVVDFLSQTKDIDRWLSSATSSFELFNMVDEVGELVSEIYNGRFEDKHAAN